MFVGIVGFEGVPKGKPMPRPEKKKKKQLHVRV